LPTYLSEPEVLATVILVTSSVICLSCKTPKPRIFTAKTLRSSRKVRISCLPLRSLRLGGKNIYSSSLPSATGVIGVEFGAIDVKQSPAAS